MAFVSSTPVPLSPPSLLPRSISTARPRGSFHVAPSCSLLSSIFTTLREILPFPKPAVTPPPSLSSLAYLPYGSAPYPYYVIQLSEKGELPLNGHYVSDIIAEYVANNPVTHIIAQTHGWNTSPTKAISIPFTEFISKLQQSPSMPLPSASFRPLFLAFIWPSLPTDFVTAPTARSRAQLIARNERENGGEGGDVEKVAKAVSEDADDVDEALGGMALEAEEEEVQEEGDTGWSNLINDVRRKAKDGEMGMFGRGVMDVGREVLSPFEYVLFGRLIARGNRVGKVMRAVLAKFMKANEGRGKVCLMANSLGAHVLAGALKGKGQWPYKVHTVFFVQGAIERGKMREGGRFEEVKRCVAGPVVASFSEKDRTLKWMFDMFRDDPVGVYGFRDGHMLNMKGMGDLAGGKGYEWKMGEWNSVNGVEFINEGDFFSGGHGDFKDAETVAMYWDMINADVEEKSYQW